ncbi:MAG: CBS domain-containing protein [Actinobacteria bacterium]|uniref:CBS domain protein n=1 Tax=hydrothermal vent metagenome TaxID=652676 RepID=A0A3B0SYI3_9ZZZZ|nr:CBS domain-containing protein [Actinomycetota bacterium]
MHLERTVQHLLGEKGRDVWSVSSDTTVYEALEYMAEKGIGAVVVIDDGNLSGIFSERDYARKVVLMGRHSRDMKVAELMSTDVITAAMTDSVMTCMTVMSERRFRHLPVVEDGDVVGVVSIGDVVRNVIEEQRYLIDQLQQYITS